MTFDVSKPIKHITDYDPCDCSLSLKEVIVKSSNIGTAQIANLIGKENQKSGISKDELRSFFLYCKEVGLNIIGLMCIPPINHDPVPFFKELKDLNDSFNLSDLSMCMSSDYMEAIENYSTYLRIGSNIFGQRN